MAAKHFTTFLFTKDRLDELTPSDKRQYYRDDKQDGLRVAVMPSGVKSFQVVYTRPPNPDRDPKDKTGVWSLGKYDPKHTKLEAVRKACRAILAKVDSGIDPMDEKREKAAAVAEKQSGELTVKQAVEIYVDQKRTGKQKLPLKESTAASYKKTIAALLGDHYESTMVDIDEDLIAKQVGKASSPALASTGCRSLSAVWSWTRKKKEYRRVLPENPVKLFAEDSDGLYVAPKRTDHLRKEYLADFFDATDDHKHGECLQWMLLTGNRLEEARGLDWADLNFRTGLYTLHDPKNRTKVELPIPTSLVDALKARRGKKQSGRVFTMPTQNSRLRGDISDKIDLPFRFTNHDLRRSFATYGIQVCDHLKVKLLMNHLISDITFDYAQIAGADLVGEMRKIEAAILAHAGRTLPSDNVVRLVS